MKRRKKRHLRGVNWDDAPYLTYGRFVYLGRCSAALRVRACKAGLLVVNAKYLRKVLSQMQVIQRISVEGRWYDTVKY